MVDLIAPIRAWRSASVALVDRPRLRAVLDDGAPLVVLRGPRGAGKSTLVEQWVATLAAEPCVVRLVVGRDGPDAADAADLWARLEQAVMAARRERYPADPASVVTDVAGPECVTTWHRVRREIEAVDGPVLLVLEHAERIRQDVVHRDLVELVEAVPRLRVVVCSEVVTPVERYAVADVGAVVLDFATLRFTLEETTDVLRANGVPEAPQRAVEMVELLHGWPGPTVALMVHRSRLPGGWDAPLEPRVYAGLVEELLVRLGSDGFRRFLVRTSVVEELTPELAQALDGTPQAPEHFARLAASVFVRVSGPALRVGTSGDRGTTGVPRLALAVTARHALTTHLQWTDPELLAELHTTAARWYHDAGDPVRAARHAYAAPAPELLAQVVDERPGRLFTHHAEELRTWVDGLPQAVLDRYPIAASIRAVVGAGSAASAGEPGEGAWADPSDLLSLVRLGLPLLIALHSGGRYGAAAELSREQSALARRSPEQWRALDPDARTVLLLQWGLSHLLTGDLQAAQRELRAAHLTGQHTDSAYLARNAAVDVALVRVLLHDLVGAEEWLARAEALPRAEGFAADIVEEWDPLVRALVASHRVRHQEAERALAAYRGRGPNQPGWIFEAFTRAHLAVLGADPAEAMARLERDRTDHAQALRDSPLAAWLLTSVGVDLALRLGRPARAQSLLDRADRTPVLAAARARTALAFDQPQEALGHVARGLAGVRGHVFRRGDLLLVRACAAQGADAATAWASALAAVRSAGTVRSLALVPRRSLAGIGAVVSGADEPLRELLGDVDTWPDAMPPVPAVVRLSEREHLVLAELARTASHQEIAQRLFVSVNTVKTQVRSIYRKLGARSRAEALTAAEEHGLDLGQGEDRASD